VSEPRVGEMIYGCQHQTACGQVASVVGGTDGGTIFTVTEDWHERALRVKREANGQLYEILEGLDLSGM
jgi:hypothetical protein